ncbi:MAG TPA: class II aldolase/adducin family protein [Pseudonocardia sp.]|jgi:ribulose-5-phosphate 4-epimerase/fuculose-1-phosphate aldolase|uniref:class II aldolase/adducin family protein n=1 Tax=Pseudonocardia sp. TaxID=60912 RepID=UPI002B93ED26|nr:class II aldolase/adducin family protein [Pseudonocardia sp.]HTF53230.1 class II aldolase/adducin family protein [Pseudonocardia sp.]
MSTTADVPTLLARQTGEPQLPTVPTFSSSAEERTHRKQRLAAAFRLFAKFGFGEGVAGHITARDPDEPHHFWVNPYGMSFSLIRASDLICVDEHGTVIHGDRPVNQAAFAIHGGLHAERPEVIAAAHAHSVFGKSLSSLRCMVDPLTQDACAFYRDHTRFQGKVLVLDFEEGRQIGRSMNGGKAAILNNHGLLTVGHTVDEAAWWFITMERTCQAQLAAMAAGDPVPLSHSEASEVQAEIGTPYAGWFQFQPLYDMIVSQQPDLLD